MFDIIKRTYRLAEPGSGITVLNMDGGEINLFGSHTVIEASEFDFYAPIKDFLTEKLVEEKADTMYNIGVAVTTGLAEVAGVAIVCAATIATGGTALVLLGAGLVSGGAAIMTGNYTFHTLASERENGYDRSWQEFYQDLNKNIVGGAVTGALVYAGILLVADTAAMGASLIESFLNAGPALAGVTATGETVTAAAAISNLDVLVSAGSIAALYEATQLGKGEGQQGVHFEESEGDKASKRESEAENWNKGSFDSAEDSLDFHYRKHGKEVGATSREQYLRKAEEFARTAKKGSTKSPVDGAVQGTIRYKKNGKFVDLAPNGSIVSFGKQ